MDSAVVHGCADARRNMANLAFRVWDIECFDCAPNFLADVEGPVCVCFRQHDDELFSTIACSEVRTSRQLRGDGAGDGYKNVVSFLMAIGVVVKFKVIDIDEQNRKYPPA